MWELRPVVWEADRHTPTLLKGEQAMLTPPERTRYHQRIADLPLPPYPILLPAHSQPASSCWCSRINCQGATVVRQRESFPTDRRAAATVRGWLTTWMARHRLKARLPVDEVVLVVVELFTNAVRVNDPSQLIPITVTLDRQRLTIEVSDTNPTIPACDTSAAGVEDESGRGLAIVAALADEHGYTAHADRSGKTAWATFTKTRS